MTKLKCILLLLLISIVISCKTTDPEEQTPTEDTSTEETIEVAEEPVEVEESDITETTEVAVDPLDEELINDAKKQIFKAEEARAETYFPKRLSDIKDILREVYTLKESDPDKARELLLQIEEEATDLTNDSWDALKVACTTILNNKTTKLLDIEADKYYLSEYKTTQDQKEITLNSFENGEFTEALAYYRIAYTSLTNLLDTLSTNLSNIKDLRGLLQKFQTEAEDLDAMKWAPKEYTKAVESFDIAEKLIYTDYNVADGEKALRDTLFLTRKAVKQSKINIEVAKTDEEILGLLNELEDASSLTVLDEEDNIISPEEWEGEATLIENPIEAEVEEDTESVLEEVDLEKDVEVDFPEVSFLITHGTTKVLGEKESRKTLLEEAKMLWQQGIDARNNGELELSQEYLAKAKVYLDEYRSMAVDYIYTVILNTEKRDCLWRIAEKEEYYNDPFKWQLIWERNKKLIQDPDLIYPGWQLIIPPLD